MTEVDYCFPYAWPALYYQLYKDYYYVWLFELETQFPLSFLISNLYSNFVLSVNPKTLPTLFGFVKSMTSEHFISLFNVLLFAIISNVALFICFFNCFSINLEISSISYDPVGNVIFKSFSK